MIYKYASVGSAIAIVKSGKVLLRSPIEFNDPFDSEPAFNEKNQRKAFDLIQNGSLLRYFLTSVEDGTIPFPEEQKWLFEKERDLLFGILRKDPHYSPIPFFNYYIDYALKKDRKSSELAEKEYQRYRKTLDDKMEEARSKLLVSCFSQRNDSILMWSHYADSHRGVCLEFDEPKAAEFRPVVYSNKKLPLDVYEIASLYVGKMLLGEEPVFKDPKLLEKVSAPFYQKSKEWSYEKEVRCVYSKGERREEIDYEEMRFFLRMSPIRKVYLGCRAAGPEVEHLKRLLADRGIPMVYMEESQGKYLIVPNEKRKVEFLQPIEKKENTLYHIFEDIRKSLAAEAYLSAFSLALMVPSICGAVVYPKITDPKTRYVKWVDENLPCAMKDNSEFAKGMAYASGEVCYAVKEQLSDFGNLRVPEDFGSFHLKKITLITESKKPFDIYVNSDGPDEMEINVRDFCDYAILMGEACYQEHSKEIDELPQIDFRDYDRDFENMEECGIVNRRIRNGKT